MIHGSYRWRACKECGSDIWIDAGQPFTDHGFKASCWRGHWMQVQIPLPDRTCSRCGVVCEKNLSRRWLFGPAYSEPTCDKCWPEYRREVDYLRQLPFRNKKKLKKVLKERRRARDRARQIKTLRFSNRRKEVVALEYLFKDLRRLASERHGGTKRKNAGDMGADR